MQLVQSQNISINKVPTETTSEHKNRMMDHIIHIQRNFLTDAQSSSSGMLQAISLEVLKERNFEQAPGSKLCLTSTYGLLGGRRSERPRSRYENTPTSALTNQRTSWQLTLNAILRDNQELENSDPREYVDPSAIQTGIATNNARIATLRQQIEEASAILRARDL
jgi:hypothetical protein